MRRWLVMPRKKTRDCKPQNTLPIIAPGTGLFGSELPIRLAKAKMTRVLACFDAKTAKLIPEKQRLADMQLTAALDLILLGGGKRRIRNVKREKSCYNHRIWENRLRIGMLTTVPHESLLFISSPFLHPMRHPELD
jgi:hypothetical protein